MEISLEFKKNSVSVTGVVGIPLEIKMLAVLRVLGRATCFDGIEEIGKGDEETFRSYI